LIVFLFKGLVTVSAMSNLWFSRHLVAAYYSFAFTRWAVNAGFPVNNVNEHHFSDYAAVLAMNELRINTDFFHCFAFTFLDD